MQGPPSVPYQGQPAAAAPQGQTNGMAIASLVCGILGFFLFIPAIPGVIFGHIALRRIKREGGEGHGLAVAGVVLSWIAIGLIALTLILAAFVFIAVSEIGPAQVAF